MPWLTIIMWVLSFLAAGGTKSGQAGKAALIATGVAAATYYAAEPTNPDAVFGDTTRSVLGYDPSPDPSIANATTGVAGVTPKPLPSIGSQAISTVGDVAKSWGAAGTMGVIAGTTAVTGSGIFSNIPWWVLAGGAFLILSR